MATYRRKKSSARGKRKKDEPTLARKTKASTAAAPKRRTVAKRPGAKSPAKRTVKRSPSPKAAPARKPRVGAVGRGKSKAEKPKKTASSRKKPARKATAPARKPGRKSPVKRSTTGAKRPVAKRPTGRKRPVAKRPAVKRPATQKRTPLARKPTPKKRSAAQYTKGQKARAAAERKNQKLAALERERQKNKRKRGAKGRPTKAEVAKKRRELEKKSAAEYQRKVEEKLEDVFEQFEELLGIAKQKKQIPTIPGNQRTVSRYESDKSQGQRVTVVVNEFVTFQNVEDILYNIEQKGLRKMREGLWPIWMAVFEFSFMGERLVGYGMRVLDDKHPLASQFFTRGIVNTGVFLSKDGLVNAMRSELEDLSSEMNTVVHLNHVTITNFRRTR